MAQPRAGGGAAPLPRTRGGRRLGDPRGVLRVHLRAGAARARARARQRGGGVRGVRLEAFQMERGEARVGGARAVGAQRRGGARGRDRGHRRPAREGAERHLAQQVLLALAGGESGGGVDGLDEHHRLGPLWTSERGARVLGPARARRLQQVLGGTRGRPLRQRAEASGGAAVSSPLHRRPQLHCHLLASSQRRSPLLLRGSDPQRAAGGLHDRRVWHQRSHRGRAASPSEWNS
mmetsp:Transcript_34818/g.86608  ORF Transcript_34818/g.86608 Transcript_34818/m.86608 type:complete len:234 (+) Transcript_34818:364-1065(+)